MEGLEASIVTAGILNEEKRFDSQFFKKAYLVDDQALNKHALLNMRQFAFVTDGPHGYHEVDEASPIAMLTAKCASGWFADRRGADTIAQWVDDANRRSSLEVNDLILSTRGTVGHCSIVTLETLPANLDQDVARIALTENSPVRPFFLLAYLNSRFGQDHILRHLSGMVQQGLSLAKVRDIPVPVLSDHFQIAVSATIERALRFSRTARDSQSEAQDTLLDILGLADWKPPEPLSYTARAKDALAAGRIDARFFAPRIQALLDIINRDGRTVGDVASPRRHKFRASDCKWFHYIEIGNIGDAGAAESTRLASNDAPSRATWHVEPNDLITSTVRPIRRLTAKIAPEQSGHVCSSGFVVVTPHSIAPDLLLTYLRLPAICELLDLYASASMYPAVTEAHILSLPIPETDATTEACVVTNMRDASTAKADATRLLHIAKRAVQIAIEEDVDAGIAFLDRAGSAS